MLKIRFDGFLIGMLCAVALGLAAPASGHWAEILSWTTRFAIGLLLFLHGARLSTADVLKGLRNWRLHSITLAVTFALYPALGLAVGAAFGGLLPDDLRVGIVFFSLVSATVQICVVHTAVAGGDVAAAVVAASMSSTLGVFVTPALAAAVVVASRAAHLDLRTIVAIVAQLLLPLVAGQTLHSKVGSMLQRHDHMLRRVDRSLVLVMLFFAFSMGTAAGIWRSIPPSRFALVVVLCAGILATALAIIIAAGKVLAFPRGDLIAIAFVGTSKSLVTGLPVATAMFAGRTAALVVLPLLVYHQIWLVISAFVAQRLRAHMPANSPHGAELGLKSTLATRR